ncbi:MAG: hypothetical protein P8X74_19275 [Reinekea sp.]
MACTLRRYGVTDSGIYHQPSIFSEIFERAGTDCTRTSAPPPSLGKRRRPSPVTWNSSSPLPKRSRFPRMSTSGGVTSCFSRFVTMSSTPTVTPCVTINLITIIKGLIMLYMSL